MLEYVEHMQTYEQGESGAGFDPDNVAIARLTMDDTGISLILDCPGHNGSVDVNIERRDERWVVLVVNAHKQVSCVALDTGDTEVTSLSH